MVYSARYISYYFLPDKAIDLVDEAESSLCHAQESNPDMAMQIELTSPRNESDLLSAERREALERALERTYVILPYPLLQSSRLIRT